MAVSLLGLGAWLAGSLATAQSHVPHTQSVAATGTVLLYTKPANSSQLGTKIQPYSGIVRQAPVWEPKVNSDPTWQQVIPAKDPPSDLTVMQLPKDRKKRMGDANGVDDSPEYPIQLEVPGKDRLFRLESEASLQERMRQEARDRNMDRIAFPEESPLTKDKYQPRRYPTMARTVEPNYLCHGRLLFEEPNSERYGWDLGILQPIVSTGKFALDFAMLPYNLATRPCQRHDSSAGKCLPGDPVPYLLYPPEISVPGTVAEGCAIATMLVFFP